MTKLVKKSRFKLADRLTALGLMLAVLGMLIGLNGKKISTRTTTLAANSCAYTFLTPSLTQLEGKLICAVPASVQNIPTIGCSLAQDGQWAADSQYIDANGTVMQFELTLHADKKPGTYDLIAYEFDQQCSHPDKIVQVLVSSIALNPTAKPVLPTPISAPTTPPTPTSVPECIAQNLGQCASEALCKTDQTAQVIGDYGCSQLKPNWQCCSGSAVPTETQEPSPTAKPPLPPLPTATNTPAPVVSSSANANISVTSQTCDNTFAVTSLRSQSWVYRTNADGSIDVVPILGTANKQQVVDAVCE